MLCRWNRYPYTNSLLCTSHAVLGNFLFLHVLSWRHNLAWLYTQWIICLPAGALPRVVPTINQQVQQEGTVLLKLDTEGPDGLLHYVTLPRPRGDCAVPNSLMVETFKLFSKEEK